MLNSMGRLWKEHELERQCCCALAVFLTIPHLVFHGKENLDGFFGFSLDGDGEPVPRTGFELNHHRS
uniref:Uncharacterized protein n=1 Tax=Knipowitschia caucasica TaxID=637954 RepID=A0AAV2MBQ7_KNICA